MFNRIPFREMRQALTAAKTESGLLLALPSITWPPNDYAFFMSLAQMTQAARKQNPTRKQMLAMLGAWLRFYKRLVEALPVDNEVRARVQVEFDTVSAPYQGLFNDTKSL